jgi:hypothetical protein
MVYGAIVRPYEGEKEGKRRENRNKNSLLENLVSFSKKNTLVDQCSKRRRKRKGITLVYKCMY